MLKTIDRAGSILPPLVLLHGYGADENDLVPLASSFGTGRRLLSVRAPKSLDWGGYGWFDIEMHGSAIEMRMEQATESLRELSETLESLEVGPAIVAGFSQGGMMALGLLATKPELVAGVIAMSAALLPVWNFEDSIRVPVAMTHGIHDEIVPFASGRSAFETISERGKVDFHSFAGGHTIDDSSLSWIQDWVERNFPNPT